MTDQVHEYAHLRPLPGCSVSDCGKPATQQLYNGLNAPMNHYCDKHAAHALDAYKAMAR